MGEDEWSDGVAAEVQELMNGSRTHGRAARGCSVFGVRLVCMDCSVSTMYNQYARCER